MNYLNRKYPNTFQELSILLKEGNGISRFLEEQLNNKNSPTLGEIFKNHNGKTIRCLDNFIDFEGRNNQWIAVSNNRKLNNFTGIYLFGELDENSEKYNPVYVGISRNVFTRLRQHGWGKTSSQATLAHLKAKLQLTEYESLIFRNPKWNNPQEKLTIKNKVNQLRESEKVKIRNYKVSVCPIKEDEDYELAFFELVVAGILKTKWNSFRTH